MSLVDRFKGWNRQRIMKHRLAKPPVQTPFGFKMNAIPSMQNGKFEPDETALVRTLLARTDRFVNVGANMGYYCLFAAQAGIATTALEPVPSNVRFIVDNLRANGWDNAVTLLPVAAGAEAGLVDIYGVGTGSSILKSWGSNPESTRQIVPAARLDAIVTPPKPDQRMFILMDVEGYETFALRGAHDLITAAHKPVWVIEIVGDGFEGTRNPEAQAAFDIMRAAGYVAMRADDSWARVDGPQQDATNFLFYDEKLSLDEVLGPEGDRTPPLAV